jgi:hypothetical protein
MAYDFTKHDDKFRYQMLSRLQQDCEYYLGNGQRNPKHLWSQNEKEHIEDMKALYNLFDDDKKPEWITWEDILNYEKDMVNSK